MNSNKVCLSRVDRCKGKGPEAINPGALLCTLERGPTNRLFGPDVNPVQPAGLPFCAQVRGFAQWRECKRVDANLQ